MNHVKDTGKETHLAFLKRCVASLLTDAKNLAALCKTTANVRTDYTAMHKYSDTASEPDVTHDCYPGSDQVQWCDDKQTQVQMMAQ